MSNLTRTCRWVVKPAAYANGAYTAAVYCDKPVSYEMVRDDDHNLRRKYATFCHPHAVKAALQDQEDEDAIQ